jgi:uncharacterized protein DUF6365
MAGEQLRAVFLSMPSRAYGEINTILPVARSVADAGGDVWILASPLAASLAQKSLPGRVFEMGPNKEHNQATFWRVVKKYRANMVVFSEFYEVLQPRRKTDCPLLDARFFARLDNLDASLVFMDFISHVPALQEIAGCALCSRRFGGRALMDVLARVWVILPCPLNEPGPVEGRRGLPFRSGALPVSIDPDDRARVRRSLLGAKGSRNGILIVRSGSTWQSGLAERLGVRLYDHLTDLLAIYLRGVKRPVTLVSVSDQQQLRPDRSNTLRVVNIGNLPPGEYQRLVLSADLVLTDNQIGYTLATTIGTVPGGVIVNSYSADDILGRERYGSPLWKLVQRMERESPGSIYPHQIFPLPLQPFETDAHANGNGRGASAFGPQTIRLGRMHSSPYVELEIYGGNRTADKLRWLLDDPSARASLLEQDMMYIDRLSAIDDGATLLNRVCQSRQLEDHTVW